MATEEAGGRVTQEPVTVWGRPERGARGPAAAHSRAELTAVAVELADREGLSAVTMRQVAKALGTGQASLYRYVSGFEDLLDLMSDAVTAEVALDVPLEDDPVEDLVALAVRTKAVQLRHPWLLDVPRSLSGWAPGAWTTWNTRCGPWRPPGCRGVPGWKPSP